MGWEEGSRSKKRFAKKTIRGSALVDHHPRGWFVRGVRINGFVAGARNFMGFRNNDERIVCYRTRRRVKWRRERSRLVKSSPPHCLRYLVEVYVYTHTTVATLLLLLVFRVQGS